MDEAENLSDKIRRGLKLGNAPIKDIFTLLEDQGVFVVRMPIKGDGLSGAFYYDKNTKTAKILINSNRSQGHQIFTAAHEFCHFLLDKEEQIIVEHDDKAKSPMEKRADAFAANFLLPTDGVHSYIRNVLKKTKKLSNSDLVKLQNEFKTSWGALIYRLHNLEYLFDKGYRAKLHEISKLNALSVQFGLEPEKFNGDGEFTLPSSFHNLAFSAYFDEKISLERLSNLLRHSYEETKELVTKIKPVDA